MYWLFLIPLLFATQVNAQTLSLEAEEFWNNITDCNNTSICNDEGYVIESEDEDFGDVTYIYHENTTIPKIIEIKAFSLLGLGLLDVRIGLKEDRNIDFLELGLLWWDIPLIKYEYEFWDNGNLKSVFGSLDAETQNKTKLEEFDINGNLDKITNIFEDGETQISFYNRNRTLKMQQSTRGAESTEITFEYNADKSIRSTSTKYLSNDIVFETITHTEFDFGSETLVEKGDGKTILYRETEVDAIESDNAQYSSTTDENGKEIIRRREKIYERN